MLYLNIIVAGLLTGAVYGLMALGLSVIFGVIRIVNFAHGEMMVLAMYAAFMLNLKTGLDPLVAMPLVIFRMQAEERLLATCFGERFDVRLTSCKRLIPWVY